MINIAGLTPVDDPSYRYRMPRLVPKVEGRGNGIKTVLTNVVDIGTALNRDPAEITKFFGFELGAQTTFSVEEDNRAIVNGSHTAQDLHNLLSKYIEHYVLCKSCRLPETQYKIKGGIISQKCLACGSKDMCDMTHKLSTFIVKHHQKAKTDAKVEEAKSEKDKKKEKKKEKSTGGEEKGEDGHDEEDVEKKEKKSKKDKSDKDKDSSKDKEKKKEKKEKKRKDEDEDHEEADDENDHDAVDAAIEQFKQWSLNPTNASAPSPAILNELRSIQTLSSLRPSDRFIIFLGANFTENAIANNEVEKFKNTLVAMTTGSIQQRHLIAASEWFCGVRHAELLRRFPVMLKQFYDADLVEEETFYSWATDYTRNEFTAEASLINIDTLESLKHAAQPFINWLQAAEEEGEEGDEEDDDEGDDTEVEDISEEK